MNVPAPVYAIAHLTSPICWIPHRKMKNDKPSGSRRERGRGKRTAPSMTRMHRIPQELATLKRASRLPQQPERGRPDLTTKLPTTRKFHAKELIPSDSSLLKRRFAPRRRIRMQSGGRLDWGRQRPPTSANYRSPFGCSDLSPPWHFPSSFPRVAQTAGARCSRHRQRRRTPLALGASQQVRRAAGRTNVASARVRVIPDSHVRRQCLCGSITNIVWCQPSCFGSSGAGSS